VSLTNFLDPHTPFPLTFFSPSPCLSNSFPPPKMSPRFPFCLSLGYLSQADEFHLTNVSTFQRRYARNTAFYFPSPPQAARRVGTRILQPFFFCLLVLFLNGCDQIVQNPPSGGTTPDLPSGTLPSSAPRVHLRVTGSLALRPSFLLSLLPAMFARTLRSILSSARPPLAVFPLYRVHSTFRLDYKSLSFFLVSLPLRLPLCLSGPVHRCSVSNPHGVDFPLIFLPLNFPPPPL